MDLALVLLSISLAFGVGLLVRRRNVETPWLALIRVLFPSYRFFDDVSSLPSLWVRVMADEADEGATWRAALSPPARTLRQLFWNPEGNLQLAHCALLERLLDDLAEAGPIALEAAQRLPSFRMVARLARLEARAPEGALVQFKLCDGDPAADVLTSAPERA